MTGSSRFGCTVAYSSTFQPCRDSPSTDLYEAYPDFDIDVRREQALLLDHELILMQHPLHWYSVPALLKQWQDLVLEHGWAYGTGGSSLRGKRMASIITSGGGPAAYTREGLNRYTVRELLEPVEQTARLCGMRWLPPFVVHGTHRLTPEAIARAGDDYARVLEALRPTRSTSRRSPRLRGCCRSICRRGKGADVHGPDLMIRRRSSTSPRRSSWCRSRAGSGSARCSATWSRGP